MNILVNAYFLTRPYTGFGNYAIGLLKALKEQKTLHKFYAMVPADIDKELIDKIESANLEIVKIPQTKWLPKTTAKFLWEQFQLPRTAKKLQCDLIHHFYPATAIFTAIAQMTVIHDVIPWNIREYQDSLAVRILRAFIKWSSRRAKLILTISQCSKNEIAKTFHLPADKIRVVYAACDQEFYARLSAQKKERLLKKYQVRKPYIFYIGGFDIRKNVKRMVLAFANISRLIEQKLVIAGGVFSPQKKIYQDYFFLPQLIKSLGVEDRIQFIGSVPPEDLPALYQAADLFLSPSLAEGFNIPLVEAFASKVPVICHNESATAEISQGAAEEIDCRDIEKFQQTIIKVLQDKKEQAKIVQRQLERAKKFSWDKAAKEILEIYDTMSL